MLEEASYCQMAVSGIMADMPAHSTADLLEDKVRKCHRTTCHSILWKLKGINSICSHIVKEHVNVTVGFARNGRIGGCR